MSADRESQAGGGSESSGVDARMKLEKHSASTAAPQRRRRSSEHLQRRHSGRNMMFAQPQHQQQRSGTISVCAEASDNSNDNAPSSYYDELRDEAQHITTEVHTERINHARLVNNVEQLLRKHTTTHVLLRVIRAPLRGQQQLTAALTEHITMLLDNYHAMVGAGRFQKFHDESTNELFERILAHLNDSLPGARCPGLHELT